MSIPEHWLRILQRKIDQAPVEPVVPRPLPIPRSTPKAAGGSGRLLTEAELFMFKRITGTSPRPGMTRQEFNRVIAKYRRGGGMQ